MRAADLAVLRRLDLFSSIEEGNLDDLTRGAYLERVPPRLSLLSEGESADFLHVIIEGAVERLANYLLRENQKQGASGDLTHPMEKGLLASLLGMTPENLSRAFATLRPYGVEVDRGEIRLAPVKKLTALAKPLPLIYDPDS